MAKTLLLLSLNLLAIVLAHSSAPMAAATTLRFEITVAPGLICTPQSGRLFVVMSRQLTDEPRQHFSDSGLDGPSVVG